MTQGLSYRFNPSPLMLRIAHLGFYRLPWWSVCIFSCVGTICRGWFIAGLITALANDYSVHGTRSRSCGTTAQSQVWSFVEIWIGTGLVIAGLTGLGAWFWGRPFLTSAHFYVSPPILGEMHLATAALFDVGVYITVVGATMLLISVLRDSRHSSMSGPVPKGINMISLELLLAPLLVC